MEDVARCWTKEVAEPGENSAGRGGGGGGGPGGEIVNPSSSLVEEAALLLLVKLFNSCLRELNEVRISFSFASTSTGNPSRCSTSPALSSCISLDPSCTIIPTTLTCRWSGAILRSRLTVAPFVLPTSDRHISPGEISPEPDVGQKWLQSGTAVTAALTAWERLNVQKSNRHRLGAEGD